MTAIENNGFDFSDGNEAIFFPIPIAISIAAQLFIDPKTSAFCEFVRSKYEYRGDYQGNYRIIFAMSTAFPRGWIDIKSKN